MAEGTSENAMPNSRISIRATSQLSSIGMENVKWINISIMEPIIMIVAPFPLRSYKFPKNGVKRILPNGSKAGMTPDHSGSIPNLLIIRFGAYFKKGKTAE